MRIYEIAEVVAHVRGLLKRDALLGDLWVRGEIGSVSYARSGHVYFSLREQGSQLDCVMFKRAAQYLQGRLEVGQAVIVHGAADLYEARGQFQVYADLVEQEGVGLWRLQFELLCRRLAEEGLFAEERKRPLPAFPRRIGLATSAAGAVRHDIARVLARRYPLAELVLVDCAVQGDGAPESIVAALRRLNEYCASRLPAERAGEAIDVIILARGGGAPEELACFSDEAVARAIFASPIPVVSAIGHETDYTIADLVADVRAPTPSVAAELVAPDLQGLRDDLGEARRRLAGAALAAIQDERHRVSYLRQQLLWRSPQSAVLGQRQRIDELAGRARLLVRQALTARAAHIAARRLQLLALSPATTLARGYALVYDEAGEGIVSGAEQVRPGDRIQVRVQRGTIFGAVESTAAEPNDGARRVRESRGVVDEYEPTAV